MPLDLDCLSRIHYLDGESTRHKIGLDLNLDIAQVLNNLNIQRELTNKNFNTALKKDISSAVAGDVVADMCGDVLFYGEPLGSYYSKARHNSHCDHSVSNGVVFTRSKMQVVMEIRTENRTTPKEALWLVRGALGAVVADNIIHSMESVYLM